MHHSQRICHLLSLSLLTYVPDLWDCINSNVNPFLPVTTEYCIQSARLSFPLSELAVLLLPPFESKGRDTPACGGRGLEDPIPTKGILCSMYTVIPPVEEVCSSSSYDTVVIFGLRDCSFIRILQTRPEGEGREEGGVTPRYFYSACIIFRCGPRKL
jgi:hypothetical protein